jgi:hypothetical protein
MMEVSDRMDGYSQANESENENGVWRELESFELLPEISPQMLGLNVTIRWVMANKTKMIAEGEVFPVELIEHWQKGLIFGCALSPTKVIPPPDWSTSVGLSQILDRIYGMEL